LAVAALWCVGLLVAAVTLPAYRSTTATVLGTADSSTAAETTTTRTLLDVNGPGVLVVVAIPLAAVGLVSGALWLRRRRHRDGAGPLAWTIVGLVGLFALLGMLSIGIFVVPAVALLAIACATAPQSPRQSLPPPPQVTTARPA